MQLRRELTLALVILSAVTTSVAQDLHTFTNGEVADAEKINENFQYVLENATGSGGCTVEQVANAAEITCTDGTTAVVPGYGTVVVLPSIDLGSVDASLINTGDIVIKDANDVTLGIVVESDYGGYLFDIAPNVDGFQSTLIANVAPESVFIGPFFGGSPSDIRFTEANCQGTALLSRESNNLFTTYRDDLQTYYLRDDAYIEGSVLSKSRYSPPFHFNSLRNSPGGCTDEDFALDDPHLAKPFVLPDELLHVAYPIKLEQTP